MPSDYTVIEYTTDFGGIVKPYDTKAFGDAQIVSNTYENGKGVLKFDIPITTIGYQAFYNSLLTSVTIPASVTSIGKDAFYGCSRLTSVHITNLSSWCKIDFTNSGANPLSYANAKLYLNGALVESLTIPSDITKIKQYAFCDCTSLQSVTITNSVTSIEKYAFYKCNQLESVVIPNSVRTIGEYAFTQCSLLSSIVIPNSVTEIKESTFAQCGLTDIKIGNQVKYIRYRAFYGHKCAKIIIPDNVIRIEEDSFLGALSSLVIGKKVSEIFNSAFKSDKLMEIYCKAENPPAIQYEKEKVSGSNIYTTTSSFKLNEGMKIYVPRNSAEAYKSAEYWSDYADSIVGYDF